MPELSNKILKAIKAQFKKAQVSEIDQGKLLELIKENPNYIRIVDLLTHGYSSSAILRFKNKLLELQGFEPRTVNYYASKVDPIYSANYIFELVIYQIDINKANEYASKYRDRFNDFNLLFLLRAGIGHQFIGSSPRHLSGRDIVLAKAGVIDDKVIKLGKELPDLLLDSIHQALKSGMSPDQIKASTEEYNKLETKDDLDPSKIDRYARLCLISAVPYSYYKTKLNTKLRLILDQYNREELKDQTDLLSDKLEIQELNKLPIKYYYRMHELLKGAKPTKPIAVYLTTNDDYGDYLLFSAWHEALSLTDNYELFIIEANNQEQILTSLENIKAPIAALVISYHGSNNKEQALVINSENQISETDQVFIKALDQYLDTNCKALISCCHSNKVAEMIFNTSKKITELYAPGTLITYGCLKSLPEPVFFEDSSSLLKWERSD